MACRERGSAFETEVLPTFHSSRRDSSIVKHLRPRTIDKRRTPPAVEALSIALLSRPLEQSRIWPHVASAAAYARSLTAIEQHRGRQLLSLVLWLSTMGFSDFFAPMIFFIHLLRRFQTEGLEQEKWP